MSSEENDGHEKNLNNLKSHIVSCPNVNSKSKATLMVIEFLDKELLRLDRDKKLQKKFSTIKSSSSSLLSNKNNSSDIGNDIKILDDDIVKISSPLKDGNHNHDDRHDDDDMEWQDINANTVEDGLKSNTSDSGNINNSNGMKGKLLSEITINKMSSNNILVKSHISAIVVALHGAILHLGFNCTGIPEPEDKKCGFAPAVRDLPKHLYLPSGWQHDEKNDLIRIRYRKPQLGTRILRCKLEPNEEGDDERNSAVSIYFHSTTENKEDGPELSFSLYDHINIYSFQKALEKNIKAGIPPALHYKALHVLLNKFCNIFDLGDHPKEQEKGCNMEHQQQYSQQPCETLYAEARTKNVPDNGMCNPLQVNRHRTDFESDITPPSLRIDPSIMHPLGPQQPSSSSPGNLMGPNHPMFHQNEDDLYNYGAGPPSFGGMAPRFDPYGPPSLLGPNGRGRGRGRKSRVPHNIPGGDPNPDHLKPPNKFDPGDMYL